MLGLFVMLSKQALAYYVIQCNQVVGTPTPSPRQPGPHHL
jgi:hypothetical protein